MEPPPVALVTGGSSGIGAAICDRFSARGDRVFNADLRPPATSGSAHFIECDITSDAAVERAINTVMEEAGRLDILVNNAGGVGSPYTLAEMTSESWNVAFDLLVGGPRRLITAALPALGKSSDASIVNIASICGLQPGWSAPAYAVAKAALIKLTEEAAAEFARLDIRVNAVSPGFIPTPIFGRTRGLSPEEGERLKDALLERAHNAQPLPRSGSAEAVAGAVAYLTSEAAAFVTGVNLVVDGGLNKVPAHVWHEGAVSPVGKVVADAREAVDTPEDTDGQS